MEAAVCPVSTKAPFLSNLNVIDNIALVNDSAQNFLHKSTLPQVLEKLRTLGLESYAYMHHSKLDDKVSFLVQLLRAASKKDATIIIDSPFLMVPAQRDLNFIMEALLLLEIESDRVLIIDIASQTNKYKGDMCHIEEC